MNTLVSSISKLSLSNRTFQRVSIIHFPVSKSLHTSPANHFQLTGSMDSAMMKRKRRNDPMKDKVKDERRMKRLTKALRKMEKKERQPKPVIEMEVPSVLYSEATLRTRDAQVPDSIREERHYFMKDWSNFANRRHRNEIYGLDRKLYAQQEALDQLRQESMSLYLEACQIDPMLVPFAVTGPTITPPIKDYIQDGEYKDVTREYKVIYEDTEVFLKKLVSKVRRKKKKDEDED